MARVTVLAITALVGFTGVGVAYAAAAPQRTPRTLGVSVPPDATVIAPGQAATIPVRVVNPGAAAIAVTLSPRGVTLADDGKVRIVAAPDPLWRGRIAFPGGRITIPPRSYVRVPVNVRLPDQISADLYFIGFVVTPETSGARGVTVVNQIGAFFVIDVPGPRLRKLSAVLFAPRFAFGSSVHGIVRVRNVGHASAQLWGENDTTSSPGAGVPTQQRIDKSLVPVDTARSYVVGGKPSWPIGIVTMKIHIVYPDRDGSTTRELVVTRRVLVANPVGAVATIGAPAIAMMAWRRRRRRSFGALA